jgi:hypothetical protein
MVQKVWNEYALVDRGALVVVRTKHKDLREEDLPMQAYANLNLVDAKCG